MSIGAIFDWDGVIIDSRRQHEESWERLAAEEKRTLPEGHFLRGFGMKNDRIIPEVLKWSSDPDEVNRLARRKEELYREIVREGGIEPLPGVRPFLEKLAAAEIPCAIGSSTERKNIDAILDVIGLREFFSETVAGDDVTRGKPHPDIFLKAAEAIAFPPERCVVFEDTQVGIDSARAGNIPVIAVTTTHPREELRGTARTVDRLDELTIKDLESCLSEN